MAIDINAVKEEILKDLVMTGEAALLAGCDRRTFKIWAEKFKVRPVAVLSGQKYLYDRKDAEKLAKIIREKKRGL